MKFFGKLANERAMAREAGRLVRAAADEYSWAEHFSKGPCWDAPTWAECEALEEACLERAAGLLRQVAEIRERISAL